MVTRTMASRGFRISGSGTRSARTSLTPFQQIAFIASPSLHQRLAAGRLTFDRRDLARLDELLQPAQRAAHELRGRGPDQLAQEAPDGAAPEAVRDGHAHLG